jgi:uncharacterized protein YbaP (TraB family)
MMKRILWACCLLLSTTLAWAQAPVPMMWKVSDADNSIYLLGSFHMLKPSDYPLAPSVGTVLADVQQVYFEVAPQEMADPALPARMMQAATRTDGKTLQQAVSPAPWRALQRYAGKNHLDVASLQGFKPWFVAMLLALTESQKLGLNPALGLDQYLMERAAQAGKPTHGLETAEAQIAMLDSLDGTLQDAYLQDSLREVDDFQSLFEELHTAWRQGDTAALERTALAEMRDQYPVLYQRVLVDRNKAWLPQLEALLRDKASNKVLVVVGALHLVGSDGVVHMLASKGYRVERLR